MMDKIRSGRKWLKGKFSRNTTAEDRQEPKLKISNPTNFRRQDYDIQIDHEGNATIVGPMNFGEPRPAPPSPLITQAGSIHERDD
ncbi:hypothetical protein LTR10_018390 [Elasticomyces elasticus]|uniref:Uncharacterized protein n=1 Tax=Exophiala sideris TaxID=1016849 RepID=A0ABR0J1N0_9EURO|nr:hypothetical protein LTR10_018390 [Elasticomyces elasticus]KAK5023167.1 hypothetical protein LTS07_009389 [Exophiala sideris]KAK5028539.1 hypothetical protein LTR13_008990 [Exophiala sideris]KAK5052917.1 hypothetical protein LTR69_009486 [Exophiala sideris]KAK5178657.1 hypothetical protein LTR44_008771 [Eurotiomycetes sp. CCFEE 6388]